MAAFVKPEHVHSALQWELGNLGFLSALLHIVQKAWRTGKIWIHSTILSQAPTMHQLFFWVRKYI